MQTLIIHQTSTLFNGASHSFDLLQRLNSDAPAAWVQAHLPNADEIIDGDILREDPVGHGIIQFANGVTAYALNSGRGLEVEAVCQRGVVTALGNDKEWQLRAPVAQDHRGRNKLGLVEFPAFEHRASTLCLIEDLVRSLDTGEPPRGGAELARANTELIFAFVESHQRGGARVELPLDGSKYRLERGSGAEAAEVRTGRLEAVLCAAGPTGFPLAERGNDTPPSLCGSTRSKVGFQTAF